ncbi:MAG: MATE family efflux transporter [Eubacteriales bacterium]
MAAKVDERELKIQFGRQALLALIVPLIIEQILGVLMGIVDTMMVSGLGDAAVSGVSLVDMLCALFINVFGALATGGAVMASRAIGAGEPEKARQNAIGLVLICFAAALLLLGVVYTADVRLLHLLYGELDADVTDAARTYLLVTAVSFPFIALYNAAAALFRSMGNSRISMYASIVVNVMNIAGNALGIYVFHLGVLGAALATVAGRVASCVFLLIRIGDRRLPIHIDYRRFFRRLRGLDGGTIRGILSIGLPGSLESGTFQLGRILVLGIISSCGTVQIAANAVANNIDSFGVMPGFAFSMAVVTVVGQCVGAGDARAVRFYTRRLMKDCCITLAALDLVLFAALPLIMSFYSVSAEAASLARILIFIHNGFAMLLWTPAFVLPNAMKATGDAKFVMVVSVASMFVFRVFLSSILGMGAIGVWAAMVVDWVCRTLCFTLRWKKTAGREG